MKKISVVLLIAVLLLMIGAYAVAEQWTGSYICISGGVSGFDPMGEMTVIDEGDRYCFKADIALITNFVIYSLGDKHASSFEVTGTMSELSDDYSNVEGIYLDGTMKKVGDYIYFTVDYSNGSEVVPDNQFIFVKD